MRNWAACIYVQGGVLDGLYTLDYSEVLRFCGLLSQK
jgi:hypothetical protein